jgi:hypothetical protein
VGFSLIDTTSRQSTQREESGPNKTVSVTTPGSSGIQVDPKEVVIIIAIILTSGVLVRLAIVLVAERESKK